MEIEVIPPEKVDAAVTTPDIRKTSAKEPNPEEQSTQLTSLSDPKKIAEHRQSRQKIKEMKRYPQTKDELLVEHREEEVQDES